MNEIEEIVENIMTCSKLRCTDKPMHSDLCSKHYRREQYQRHKEREKGHMIRWRKTHPEAYKKTQNRWRYHNRERINKTNRTRRKQVKDDLLNDYFPDDKNGKENQATQAV